MDSSLRDRLSAVARSRGAVPAARPAAGAPGEDDGSTPAGLDPVPNPRVGGRRSQRKPPLDRILPGEERLFSGVSCWVHARAAACWPDADPGLADRLAHALTLEPPGDLGGDVALGLWRARGLPGALFLDLETTGLAGVPVFLAGLLAGREDGTFEFRLYFARDYREETALLLGVAEELARHPVAVTYNGKSYDLPTLRERAARLRVPFPRETPVFDLLHPARRRWAGRFSDCRLSTLERQLCGRSRPGDISGADIPSTYHRFVQDSDPRPLLRVFRHNLMDLYTLAEVTALILDPAAAFAPEVAGPES